MTKIILKFMKILSNEGNEWKLCDGDSVNQYAGVRGEKFDTTSQLEMEMKVNRDYRMDTHNDRVSRVSIVHSPVKLEVEEDLNYNYKTDTSLLAAEKTSLKSEFFDLIDVKTEPVDWGDYENLHQMVSSTVQSSRDGSGCTETEEDISVNSDSTGFPISLPHSCSGIKNRFDRQKFFDASTASYRCSPSRCISREDDSPESTSVPQIGSFNSRFSVDEISAEELPDVSPLRSRCDFPNSSPLAEHSQITVDKPFYCHFCSFSFASINELREHMDTHGAMSFACEQCSASFTCRSDLDNHKTEHAERRPFVCSVCSASFYVKFHLDKHAQLHQMADSPTHDIFHSVFSNRRLTSLFESPAKRFSCTLCPAKFTAKSSLHVHMRVHTKEKPFGCDLCAATFAWKGNLKKHLKSHLQQTFVCEVCSLAFKSKISLISHSKVHRVWRLYECDICSLQFPRKKLLHEHVKEHPMEFVCRVCSASFATAEGERAHEEMHAKKYTCLLCAESFGKRKAFGKHLYVELEKLKALLDQLVGKSGKMLQLRGNYCRMLRSAKKF